MERDILGFPLVTAQVVKFMQASGAILEPGKVTGSVENQAPPSNSGGLSCFS